MNLEQEIDTIQSDGKHHSEISLDIVKNLVDQNFELARKMLNEDHPINFKKKILEHAGESALNHLAGNGFTNEAREYVSEYNRLKANYNLE